MPDQPQFDDETWQAIEDWFKRGAGRVRQLICPSQSAFKAAFKQRAGPKVLRLTLIAGLGRWGSILELVGGVDEFLSARQLQHQHNQEGAEPKAPNSGNCSRDAEPYLRLRLKTPPRVPHQDGGAGQDEKQYAAHRRNDGLGASPEPHRLARDELHEARQYAGGNEANRGHIEINAKDLH